MPIVDADQERNFAMRIINSMATGEPIIRLLAGLAVGIGIWGTAWAAAGEALASGQDRYQYHYVSFSTSAPPGFDSFIPVKVADSGQVYGAASICGPETCSSSAAVWRNGTVAILSEPVFFIVYTANNRGTFAGSILTDPVNFYEQAALLERGHMKLLPRLPNEVTSFPLALTNSGLVLVASSDADFKETIYLYWHGLVKVLNFGSTPLSQLQINDFGLISGTVNPFDFPNARAARFIPPNGPVQTLNPVFPDPSSWGMDINNRGAVLGYSFVVNALERIGVWRGKKFQTYFIEGNEEFPTVSNRLLWNEPGLIVITDVLTSDRTSYIVPRPGVRLNLADLTDSIPPVPLRFINDINNRGDLVGFGFLSSNGNSVFDDFLLQRVDNRHRPFTGSVRSGLQTKAGAAWLDARRRIEAQRAMHDKLAGGRLLSKDGTVSKQLFPER